MGLRWVLTLMTLAGSIVTGTGAKAYGVPGAGFPTSVTTARSPVARLEQATDDCASERAAVPWIADDQLNLIALPASDPYADDDYTREEVGELREIERTTGHWPTPDEYRALEALITCLNQNSVSQSGDQAGSSVGGAYDDLCDRLATEWLPGVLGDSMTPDAVPPLTGCWPDRDGGWILPTGYDDGRLYGGPMLTAAQWDQTGGIRALIEQQLEGFERQLPSWVRTSLDDLAAIQTDGGRWIPTTGAEYENADVGLLISQYGDALVNYLYDPELVELNAFVDWWMERRIAAVPADLFNNPNPWISDIVVTSLHLDRMPWPWELRDEVTMARFLRWAIDHGYIV